MAILYYGGSEHPIEIEDVALAHLKIVIATKLRRNESFTLSFRHGPFDPVGRTTIWLHPAIPLRFEFEEPEAPDLDPQLIRDLANSANTSGGIALKPEHILRASVWRPEAALASEAGAAPVAAADGSGGATR